MNTITIITLLSAAINTMATPISSSSRHTEFEINDAITVNWTKIISSSGFVINNSYEIQDGVYDLDGLKNLCERNSSLKSCRHIASSSQVDNANVVAAFDSVLDKQICGNFEDLSPLWNTNLESISVNEHNISIAFQGLQKRRRKRSVPNTGASPCSTGLIEKVFLYLYSNDTQYELYHNIDNHLYQTFYVRNCADSPPNLSGHTCKPEFIKSKAAVFNPITDDIEVQNVFVPATCTYQVND